MLDGVAQFVWAKYLNLETFRKTGIGVRTPVWFAQDVLQSAPAITVFYIYSEAGAGKVLTGIARRIAPEAGALNLATPADLEAFAKAL